MAAAATGFTGAYGPGSAVIATADGGSIDTSAAPDVITLNGGSDSSFLPSDQLYQFVVQGDGILSFDWTYLQTDCCGAIYDPFGYQLNGVFAGISDDFGADDQNGSFSIHVHHGDLFALDQSSVDNSSGFATTVVGNFAAPDAPVGGGVPEPATWAMMVVGFGIGGALLRRQRHAVAA
jgi:hypothetical protein